MNLLHWLGMDDGTKAPYLFWSGIGADTFLFGWIPLAWHIVRKHNCHQPGCWRVGRFPLEEWQYCRRHHPHDNPGHVDNLE